ncbi:DUF3102 domain-containing protein [Elioraea rosea]|uniref:DUF3102 domain-containing protein n=1 Tax=Elioraea rosea TaxID=2492390 RepID=UPI0013158CE6|nr:DUF3102 domain-containing protein [Elioraea rosea]
MSKSLSAVTPGRQSGFDYTRLPAVDRAQLQERAATLRSQLTALDHDVNNAKRHVMRRASEIGVQLLAIKASLTHGEFLPWCRAELELQPRTAQNFMAAARLLNGLPQGECEIVSLLPPSTLYALAAPAIPEQVRERLIADVVAGKPITPKSIRSEIRRETRFSSNVGRLQPRPKQSKSRIARENARQAEQRERRRRATDKLAELLLVALPETELRDVFHEADWFQAGLIVRRRLCGEGA